MDSLLTAALVNVLLAAVLALLVCGVARVCRRPALLHVLWLLVLLKLLAPPLWPLPILPHEEKPSAEKMVRKADARQTVVVASQVLLPPDPGSMRFETNLEPANPPLPARLVIRAVPQPVRITTRFDVVLAAEGEVAQSEETAAAAPAFPWAACAAAVWLGGAAVCLGWALRGLLRFQRLLRHAEIAPPAIQEQTRALAGRMGLKRCPEVWLLPGPLPPLVWAAFGRARLYFPHGLLGRLGEEGQASLLAHELAHVHRRDHWVRWVELLAVALYWWCPLVWWARSRLRNHEEECCDAWVVDHLPARAYAGAILETVDFLAAPAAMPALASGLGRVEALKKRLAGIMEKKVPRNIPLLGKPIVLLLVCLLPMLPVRAQPPEKKPAAEPVRDELPKPPAPVLAEIPARFEGPAAALLGGGSPILALAGSADGKLTAAAHENHIVTLRDAVTGELRGELHGHEEAVTCLAFAPGGKTIATGSPDCSVRLWDTATGKQRRMLDGHTNWVYALAWSRDGKTLASAGYDRTIRLWNAEDGFRAKATLQGHTAAVRALAWSPDGLTLVSGGSDRSACVWDLKTMELRLVLRGHEGTVRGAAFSSDGRKFATASEDRTVRLWECPSGRELMTLTGHSKEVWSVAFSPGGRSLAAGAADGAVRVWDAGTGQARSLPQTPGDGVTSLHFSSDGQALLAGSLDGAIRRWAGKPAVQGVRTKLLAGGDIWFAVVVPEDNPILLINKDGTLLWWPMKVERIRWQRETIPMGN